MAQFNIDIPGIGTITVDGNFATEDSINRLAAAMKVKSTGISSAANDFVSSVDDLNDSFNILDPAIDKSTRKFKDNEKAAEKFNKGFSKVDGLFSDLGDPGSGSLTKLVKSVGDATAGVVSGLSGFLGPLGSIVGEIASGVLGAVTGIVTTAMSFAQGLVDTNKAIHNAGLGLAGGLAAMQQAAGAANVPFQQFAKAMIDSNESLKLFAGGAPGGIKAVSNAMSKLTRENRNQYQSLLAMGYTVEDIVGTMADLGAQAGLAGQSIDKFGDLATATDEYLRTQQELNRLTGVDIKQAREKQKANNASLFVQNKLNKISDPKQRVAAESILNRVPKSLRDFVISGQSFTKAGGIMASQMPELAGKLRELYSGVERGVITQDQVDDQLKQIGKDPALQSEIKRVTDVFGNVPEELFKFDISDIQEGVMYARNLSNASKATAEAFDYAKKTAEGMDKAVVSMEQLTQDVNSGLSTLGFTLFNFVDGYIGTAGDAVGGVAQKFQNLSQTMTDWKTAQERYDDAVKGGNLQQIEKEKANLDKMNDKINSIFGTKGSTGPLDALKDKVLEIFSKLKNTISDGIQKGFAEVLTSIGYKNEFKLKEEAQQAKTNITDPAMLAKEITGIDRKVISAGRGGVHYAPLTPDQQKIETLFEKLEKLSDESLKELGYGKTSGGMFGKNKYYVLPEDKKQQTPTTEKKALGGLFDYKPGGEKITIAEAGPELVAPAKRGTDGKLGLEVSGAMLDNSKLLQSLVKINEGQASLIAGLNNKIDGMTNAMDKLVTEQRQANRLAV